MIGDGGGGLAWLSFFFFFLFNNKIIVTFWPTVEGRQKQRGSYLLEVEEGRLVLVGLALGTPAA